MAALGTPRDTWAQDPGSNQAREASKMGHERPVTAGVRCNWSLKRCNSLPYHARIMQRDFPTRRVSDQHLQSTFMDGLSRGIMSSLICLFVLK